MSSARQTHDAAQIAGAGQLQFDWSDSKPSDENKQPDQPHAQAGEPIVTDAALTPAQCVQPRELPKSPRSSASSYGPGHPWHYLPQGDNSGPVPFDDIPASEESARAMERELPKPRAKRIVAVRERLESERRSLEETRARYEAVIERGAEALGRYDREIAYGGNDELARAGTLALMFNQASRGLGRLRLLERELSPAGVRSR